MMNVTIRVAALLSAVLVSAAAQPQASAAQLPELQPPMLRSSVSITGALVRIGDLVENAGTVGSVPVFRAPDLGTTGTVGIDRVLEALKPFGLSALDTRGLSDVVVTRRSRAIHPDHIKAALANAISTQTGAARAKDLLIKLDRQPQTLQVEEAVTGELQVKHLYYDPRTGRFDATLDLPGSEALRRQATRITGAAVATVEAVVLARAVARGEMLRPTDVVIERRPRTELGADGFIAPDSALGMAPRRALAAGQLLRASDLMKPDLVTRNDLVTLVFETPGVTVSTRGKANSSGGEGETVSVTNLQSKRIIQGVVTAPGTVRVSATAVTTSAVLPTDPTVTGSIRSTPVRTEIIRPASGLAPSAEPRS
ncbi:flagellar basal body P-ring formation chaperone FlgA [Blastochloris sulfoviridis]|uniref:Flagellar basal body P-ring formation protein FlgA n=1 Tax=Blastochloris sulfoviridis TaxID=50712 RepID=A0A5M6I4Q5_9HYPH|nr:flagellar basal body P-ring formation chaperone FlgA [Blastochloris sulfoviridis]KAA5602758.1 flagellar basal body P-ring formation protein FlgA [Blastochloris sulfoviridis]